MIKVSLGTKVQPLIAALICSPYRSTPPIYVLSHRDPSQPPLSLPSLARQAGVSKQGTWLGCPLSATPRRPGPGAHAHERREQWVYIYVHKRDVGGNTPVGEHMSISCDVPHNVFSPIYDKAHVSRFTVYIRAFPDNRDTERS